MGKDAGAMCCRGPDQEQAASDPVSVLRLRRARRLFSAEDPMEATSVAHAYAGARHHRLHQPSVSSPFSGPKSGVFSGLSAALIRLHLHSSSFTTGRDIHSRFTASHCSQTSRLEVHLPLTSLRSLLLPQLPQGMARHSRLLRVVQAGTARCSRSCHYGSCQADVSSVQSFLCEGGRLQQAYVRLRLYHVLRLPTGDWQGELRAFLSTFPAAAW